MSLGTRVAACAVLLASLAAGDEFKTPVWIGGATEGLDVRLDGMPVEVREIRTPEDELILLLVLDMVKFPDRADVACNAIVEKLHELGPRFFAGVMTAQDGLRVQLDPVRGRQKLRDTLESLDVRGVPGLLDVVVQSSRIADQTLASAKVRLAVLFVTDGEIEDYRGDYTVPIVNPSDQRDLSRRFRGQLIQERVRSILDSLESAQAPLFFLHLERQYDDLNETYQNGISQLAQVTGGRALFAQGPQDIPAMVGHLLDEIAAHTVLTLEADCSRLRRLDVKAGNSPTRHKESVGCAQPGS